MVRSDLGGHRQPLRPFFRKNNGSARIGQPGIPPSFLLQSLVVKVSDFGARGLRFESHLWQSKKAAKYYSMNILQDQINFYCVNHCRMLVLQGHCPLVFAADALQTANKEGAICYLSFYAHVPFGKDFCYIILFQMESGIRCRLAKS